MAGLVPYKKHTGLSRFDPFDEAFWNGSFLRGFMGDSMPVKQFRVDIKDKKDRYEIDADLPGLKPEEIDVSLSDGYITISAEHKEEKKSEEEGYVLNERRMGRFSRTFGVGDVKEDQISAEYKDGVLKVVLPKDDEPEKKSRKIDVK